MFAPLKGSTGIMSIITPLSMGLLITLAGFSPLLGACSSESEELSRSMVANAQEITAIIKTHLNLRNGSPKNCNMVAGRLLGFVERHKAILFGLEGRLKKLPANNRKQLREQLAKRNYGTITTQMKHAKEQFKQQCPVWADAVSDLMDRVHQGRALH